MTIKEFKEKSHEIIEKGEPHFGMFSDSYYVDKDNHYRWEDGGYNEYLTYQGKTYHYGVNGVKEL